MSALKDLTERLEQDQGAPYPKFPDQARYALQDAAVAQAIERRFKGGESLVRIRSLGCHRASGLLHTVFEFTKAGAIALAPHALLVITDGRCKVVGIVDPFDPEQPNPMLPALSSAGALPLALAEASDADALAFSEEDLRPKEERTRAYLQKMNVEPGSGGVSARFFAVTTSSIVGYQHVWLPIAAGAKGPILKEFIDYSKPINGADDTGVGGDAE
jgi:hypothetical protein